MILLDATENVQTIPSNNIIDSTNQNIVPSTAHLQSPPMKTGGSEALRILEGLKSRPKTYRGYNALNTPAHIESGNQDSTFDNNSLSSTR